MLIMCSTYNKCEDWLLFVYSKLASVIMCEFVGQI